MNLILCCDYGLDDAAATVDSLSHAKKDGYQKVYLIAIGGNVPCEVAFVNAKKLAAHISLKNPEVVVVDTTEIKQPSEYLTQIHGDDGMGDLFKERDYKNVVSFEEFLQTIDGQFDLLSLGPMTLIPKILEKQTAGRFVFMGGNIAETPNFHGYEFNHALNRTAFKETVKQYPRHVAVTMDTCRNPLLNVQEEDISGLGLMIKITRRSRELSLSSCEKGCYIWDDMAVKALRHPDWFEYSIETDKDGNTINVARYIYGEKYLNIIDE